MCNTPQLALSAPRDSAIPFYKDTASSFRACPFWPPIEYEEIETNFSSAHAYQFVGWNHILSSAWWSLLIFLEDIFHLLDFPFVSFFRSTRWAFSNRSCTIIDFNGKIESYLCKYDTVYFQNFFLKYAKKTPASFFFPLPPSRETSMESSWISAVYSPD